MATYFYYFPVLQTILMWDEIHRSDIVNDPARSQPHSGLSVVAGGVMTGG